jgi:hypothetical protein
MKKKTVTAVVLIVLSIVGCSTVQVSQDYDPKQDFSRFQTWQWREATQQATGDVRIDNPLLDTRIRNAVETHLADRNFNHTESTPEMLLSYHLVIERRIYTDTYYSSIGAGAYYSPWFWDTGVETRIYQYDQSRLTIDIHAAESDALLWRGEGLYLLKTFKTPKEAEEAMQKTVDKILGQFPPQ